MTGVRLRELVLPVVWATPFLQYFNAKARPGAELLLEKIGFDCIDSEC